MQALNQFINMLIERANTVNKLKDTLDSIARKGGEEMAVTISDDNPEND